MENFLNNANFFSFIAFLVMGLAAPFTLRRKGGIRYLPLASCVAYILAFCIPGGEHPLGVVPWPPVLGATVVCASVLVLSYFLYRTQCRAGYLLAGAGWVLGLSGLITGVQVLTRIVILYHQPS